MKRFKFRLEKVLQFRKLVKDEKFRELSEATKLLNDARDYLNELETAARANGVGEGIVSASAIQLVEMFGRRMKESIEKQREKIIECEKAADVAMQAYIEALKDEKALITLKGKKLVEYQALVEKEDGKVLDELSLRRRGNP